MTFNLQSKFNMCACALIAYIANHSTRILQDNSRMERSGLKIFAHFIDECLFDVSKVVFMFNNHQVTLKFTHVYFVEIIVSEGLGEVLCSFKLSDERVCSIKPISLKFY